MDALTPVELTIDLPSKFKSDHLHQAGTMGVIVERLGPDALLVELQVADTSLEGDAWYETVEVYDHEVKIVEIV